jgi:hypothetical protein
MNKTNSLALTAPLVILWISVIASPAFHRRFDGHAPRPASQRSFEPGLFVPLLGAWTLPESPMLRISPREELTRP